MTLLTITTSSHHLPTLTTELEDIVCQDLRFVPDDSKQTLTAELGSMSQSVRNNVRECLAKFGVTVFMFDDERV